MSFVKQTSQQPLTKAGLGKVRSYSEVVDYLSHCDPIAYSPDVIARMQALDKLFDYPSKKIETIIFGGTNGKSSTINFTSKLLTEEGFRVGIAYSSHILVYNERFVIDGQNITNKKFSELLNEVINTAEMAGIKATTFELLTIAAFLFFKEEEVDILLLEVGLGGLHDATNIANPVISAVTRVAQDHTDLLGEDLDKATYEMVGIAKSDAWFISAEQSKIRLQKMKEWVDERGAKWAMPIRKLASLPYIFEQLYGRSASLAERIAQIYVEEVKGRFSPFLRGNLLATQRGQRGRPTLEAKRQAELNPIKTLKSFWNEQFDLLRGRFQLLDKEKPTILLDNAHNLDALNNLFLGIRLLHYKRPLKGFALVMGLAKHHDASEIIKLVRYLFKKVPGEIFFVPLSDLPSCYSPKDLEKVAKDLNIKAKGCNSFEEAFNLAKEVVDDRQGLLTVCGAAELTTAFWHMKDIKKFH